MATVYLFICEPHVVGRQTKVEFLVDEKDKISCVGTVFRNGITSGENNNKPVVRRCCRWGYGYLECAKYVKITGK